MFRLSIDFFPPSIALMSKVNEYSFLKAIGYIQANNTLIFSLNLIFYPSRECRLILLIDKIESKATEYGINMHLINKTQNFLFTLLPAIHLLNLTSLCSPVRCKKKNNGNPMIRRLLQVLEVISKAQSQKLPQVSEAQNKFSFASQIFSHRSSLKRKFSR